MTDDTLNLDQFRNPGAQQQTRARRQRLEVMQGPPFEDAGLQAAIERYLSAPETATLPDTVTMAVHLLRMFSMTEEAEIATRRQLIAKVIEDISRLADPEAVEV